MEILSEDILRTLLKNAKNASKNHLVGDCPFCAKEEHFFINKGINRKGIVHGWICHKCKESGSIIKLLQKLDKLYLLGGERIGQQLKVPSISFKNTSEDLDIVYEEPLDYKLPIGFKRIYYCDDNEYVSYLKDRKMTEQDFEIYKPGYTTVLSKLRNYVIIPVTKDYSVKGYIGRYIIDKKDERYDPEEKRYRNSETAFSKFILGFDELTNKTTDLVLTEGFFDKVSVTTELQLHDNDEFKCGCTFGNKVSDDHIAMLRTIKSLKNLYLMYDGRDSINIMKVYGMKLKKYWNVYVPYLPNKDPGDSNQQEIMSSLENAKDIVQFLYGKVQIKNFR